MTGNNVGKTGGPQQRNPQLGGIAAQNPNHGGNNFKPLSLTQVREAAKRSSLNEVLDTWLGRAMSGTTKDLIKLKDMSSRVRHKQPIKGRYKGVERILSQEEAKWETDKRSEEIEQAAKAGLDEGLGSTDRRTEPLKSTLRRAISALRRFSRHEATEADVNANIRRFSNLQLFAGYADVLHSTSNVRKLKRTISKIPKIVFENASADVTHEDYAKVDHLKHETGRPLLSFHRGFRASDSWIGKDRASKAYRQNLRALTASALLLSGYEKAVKVKELLTELNNQPHVAGHGKKEDMIQRVLNKLEKHGDVDALIDDLSFELESHKLMCTYERAIFLSELGENFGISNDQYRNLRGALLELENKPDRVTVLQNINGKMNDNCQGYTLSQPSSVLPDINFALLDDPLADSVNHAPNDPDRAREAIIKWAEVLVPRNSQEHDKFNSVFSSIDNSIEKPKKWYSDAARKYIGLYKGDMSTADKSLLLLSCLRKPQAPRSEHVANVKSMRKRAEFKHEKKKDIDQDNTTDPKQKTGKKVFHDKNNNVDDDIKYDHDQKYDNVRADIDKNIKDKSRNSLHEFGKGHRNKRLKYSSSKTLHTIEEELNAPETDIKADIKIEDEPLKKKESAAKDEPSIKHIDENPADNVAGGGADSDIKADHNADSDHSESDDSHATENVDVRSPAKNLNFDVGTDDDNADDSDPDGGDDMKASEIPEAERYHTPGGPENPKQED